MDTKYLSFSLIGEPALGSLESCLVSGNFSKKMMPSAIPEMAYDAQKEALWIDEQGQILDCSGSIAELFGYWKDELKGQHISVLLPDLGDSLFMEYSSPTTLWVDDQGQIVDCAGPIEEIFGYWKDELKGEHISMLLPDLAHTELVELDGENSPRVMGQSHDAIAFGGAKAEGDDSAYAVFLHLISTKGGRDLSVILRNQVH